MTDGARKVTFRDLFNIEASKLTPIAQRWNKFAEHAKAKATSNGEPDKTASLWVIATTFTASAWMLVCIHNLLTDAGRNVGP
jgi:hypothetical protein